ncbi:hypothetical protein V2J09_010341, partial [Rumex salicifolius]
TLKASKKYSPIVIRNEKTTAPYFFAGGKRVDKPSEERRAREMAIALLPAPILHTPSKRQVGGAIRSFNSTFHGQLILYRSSIPLYFGQRQNNSLAVSALFQRKAKAKAKRETRVPDADYRIPIVLLGLTGGLVYTDNIIPAIPVGLLGLLLLVQATRVRFVFDDEALEVRVGDELKESGENAFVGGKNRWKYSTFVNWEFWWPNFPILVYFKETQTKPEGQIHFFPIIFDGKQLYDVMVERAGPSKTSDD